MRSESLPANKLGSGAKGREISAADVELRRPGGHYGTPGPRFSRETRSGIAREADHRRSDVRGPPQTRWEDSAPRLRIVPSRPRSPPKRKARSRGSDRTSRRPVKTCRFAKP